ncbi:MAG: hypothetical protein ACOYL5_16100 [Phototrophicaceae bacterium]
MSVYIPPVKPSVLDEAAEFIVSRPTLEELANYGVSNAFQQRLDELLKKNKADGVTPEEQQEVEQMLILSDLMTLAKQKAQLQLMGQS